VQIVDAVQIHIFGVPCKNAAPHAKVQVRRHDPGNGVAFLLQRPAEDGVEVAEVPALARQERTVISTNHGGGGRAENM